MASAQRKETWHPLGGVSPRELADDHLQLHHAVQLLAAFGQNHLRPRDDDSHRSMTWDGGHGRFLTDPTEDGLRAGLAVATLELQLLRGPDGLATLDLRGRTDADAHDWLVGAIADARDDEPAELTRPEYEIPAHPVQDGTPFEPTQEGLAELAGWYHNAALVLHGLTEGDPDAEPVRCWPHHFDIATLITVVPARKGASARTTGAGLTPNDGSYPELYLYVNAWPAPDLATLPDLDGPGRWHVEGWVGAVLMATELVNAGDAAAQEARARSFFENALAKARSVHRS